MIIPSGGCDSMHAAMSYEALRRERDELKAALAKVTAERDALIEAIKRGAVEPCSLCVHDSVGLACDGECDCETCEIECACGTCGSSVSNFEFVGVEVAAGNG